MDIAPSSSLFNRTVARQRPAWATVLLVLIAYLPAVIAAAGNMGLPGILANPRARAIFTAPTVIAYILVTAPLLRSLQPMVIASLRPVILVGDAELARVVKRSSAVRPLHEAAAILGGLLFGLLIVHGEPEPALRWPFYVEVILDYVMFGLLGWLVLMSFVNTRVVNQLLRLPLHIDPLDITPFEAIGRQSLMIALAFVGGNLIALLVGFYGSASIADPRFWLLFVPLFLLPVAVFFLGMIPTQRILSRAKRGELEAVQAQLHEGFRLLLERRQQGEPADALAQEINALATYEQHLYAARSWPYDHAVLRALFFSILVQVAAVLTRRALGM